MTHRRSVIGQDEELMQMVQKRMEADVDLRHMMLSGSEDILLWQWECQDAARDWQAIADRMTGLPYSRSSTHENAWPLLEAAYWRAVEQRVGTVHHRLDDEG